MRKKLQITSAFVALILVASNVALGQGVKPQNIYRVTVNSRYVIENGERTSKFFAIGQLISDSLGRMHTEIDYNWETRYPDNYRWHYFDEMAKVKTDFFVKEKLSHFKVFKYNANNQFAEQLLYKVNNGDTVLAVREVHAYNNLGHRTQTTGYNIQGKRGFRTKYKYDANGSELERRVRGKRAVPSDSIIKLKRIVEYDSLNRVKSELVTIEKFAQPKTSTHTFYKYDDKGNLVEEVIKDQLKETTHRKEYVYRSDKRIQGLRLYDSQNNLLDYQAWRYEIYKTANRTHRVLE